MSDWLVSLILAVGAGTWIFNRLQQNTGYGNTSQSVIASSIAGLLIFGLFMLILTFL